MLHRSHNFTLLLFAFILLHSPVISFSQQILKGYVIDENNNPLPYVSIYLSTSKIGTVTNKNGAFLLNFTGVEDILNASYIGYKTEAVKVDKNSGFIKIQLLPTSLQLNEVVVTNLSAAALFKKAIEKIPENYPQEPFLMQQFYRAKLSKSDTPVYLEEIAFNIVKSYRRGFSDQYFLVKNRNLYLNDSLGWGLQKVANADLVKSAQQIFTTSFFQRNQVSYFPSTLFDNRSVYVLSVSPTSHKGAEGKIYIDADDLAFIRFDLTAANGNIVRAQYKKIEGKYFFMSGYVMQLNKHLSQQEPIPAEAEMITTNINLLFKKEQLEGTPISVEDYMRVYATQDTDTLFWQQHNAILPDSSILRAVNKYKTKQKDSIAIRNTQQYKAFIKRLYIPNLSLMLSTDLENDFSTFNYNINSINRFVNYYLSSIFSNKFAKTMFPYAYSWLIAIPMEETTSEWMLLFKNNIRAKINPTVFNKYQSGYTNNLTNRVLSDFKKNNHFDFMRLHTVRNDGHYVKSFLIEEELAKADLSNKNNWFNYLQLYSMELLMHRGTNSYNPFKKDVKQHNVKEQKQPLIIDRNRSWVKYLFNPDMEYQRHILQEGLLDEERKYLKRSACWSWLNLVSPQMYGIPKFKLNEKNSFTLSLNYLRTPFGEMFGQNIWLMHNYNQLHGIFVKQYRNYEKTTFGIGYKLYDRPLFKNFYSTSSFDIWQQPTDLNFKTSSSFTGFQINQLFEYQFLPHKYIDRNNLSLFVGFNFKTKGYMPESFYIDKKFNVTAGMKINL